MKSRAKSKLRALLSGFFSAFDLSGRRHFFREGETRSASGSLYRHWRRVGEDVKCTAEDLVWNHGDDELRKEVEEHLRRWRNNQAKCQHRWVKEKKENDGVKKLVSP